MKGKVRREEGRMTSATRVGIVVSMEDQTPNNLFMRMNLGHKHAKRIASKQGADGCRMLQNEASAAERKRMQTKRKFES